MDRGRALDGAERATGEETRERFGAGVQRVVLLQDGEDPRNRALRRAGLPALR